MLVSTALESRASNVISKLMRVPIVRGATIEILRRISRNAAVRTMCLKRGFLPLDVASIDYHSPVPDIDDLVARRIWDIRSELGGIDFREQAQLALLKTLGRNWGHECQWPWQPTPNPTEFYLGNPTFSFGCAASTHSMIRQFKPRSVIEIGSGMSSLVIARALALNRKIDEVPSEYLIVDPFPGSFIKQMREVTELRKQRVELLGPQFFDRLGRDSILFIDSSHTVRIGGDVNYLYLDILPRLASGVIVHVHDIALPYNYSMSYVISESFRQFWTEQYLLQAFLCYNSEFEVLLAMGYLMIDHMKEFRAAYPTYDPKHDPYGGSGSFWLRRKIESGLAL